MDGEELIKRAYESILKHDFEQAVEWFEQAISAEPENASFHYKLSITYARSNKLNKAIEHAEQAVRIEPEETAYLFHLQYLQAKNLVQQAEKYFGMMDDQIWMAVSFLKQALTLDSLSTDAYLLLAIAYERLMEYSQAIQAINELLRLDPQHEIGNRLLEEYRQKLKSYMQSELDY